MENPLTSCPHFAYFLPYKRRRVEAAVARRPLTFAPLFPSVPSVGYLGYSATSTPRYAV